MRVQGSGFRAFGFLFCTVPTTSENEVLQVLVIALLFRDCKQIGGLIQFQVCRAARSGSVLSLLVSAFLLHLVDTVGRNVKGDAFTGSRSLERVLFVPCRAKVWR